MCVWIFLVVLGVRRGYGLLEVCVRRKGSGRYSHHPLPLPHGQHGIYDTL